MISYLKGKIISKKPNEVIIDVGGVGYAVCVTLSTFDSLPQTGTEIELNIFTYVREDTLALYGFSSIQEKEIFIKLLKVSGIGPKLAVAILSGVPPHTLVEAIVNEDLARLNAIPGVGRKTAERIIIDLKDKLSGTIIAHPSINGHEERSGIFDDALSALINLGYKKVHAEIALGKVGTTKSSELGTVIKEALKELSN